MGEIPLTIEQAWKDGLNEEPEEHQRFKQRTLIGAFKTPLIEVVDLFCGGGGFTHGAINAGAKVVLAVDCWQPALDVHEANHPDVPTLNLTLGGSIRETAVLIRERLSPGSHFHLHGSPPCQALSNMSRRDSEEGVGMVLWFLDLVAYMKPDSWSMENVVPVGKKLNEHRPDTPWVKINSADWGVPQTRQRIFAGTGWNIGEPSHAKEDWITVIEALPHLAEELIPSSRIVSRRRKKAETPQFYLASDPAHTITRLPHILENIHMDSGRSSAKTCGVNPKTGKKNGGSGFLSRSIVSQPSYTITSSSKGLVYVENESVRKLRSLTLDEAKVLQGFPESFQVPTKTKKDAWIVIGNAVCPPVAEAIIRGILQ